ncbi:MAG: alpha/beta fold hydrolase [Candidatus Binatia bacterium]
MSANRDGHGSIRWSERTCHVGEQDLLVAEAGSGKPLLILHEELGCPGPLRWQASLAGSRKLLTPLHPGFGRTPRVEWIASVRDLACFYARFLREERLAPVDVIGFSLGGWIAAEMAANDPGLFSKMVLVGAAGVRPTAGEILDLFLLTGQKYLRASVLDPERTPEFTALYGADQTPEQFEAWEDCRAETARIAWQPYMHNPSLAHLLEGVRGLPTLLLWGERDRVVPPSAGEAYRRAIAGSRLVILPECNHRPEIEQREDFLRELRSFLD